MADNGHKLAIAPSGGRQLTKATWIHLTETGLLQMGQYTFTQTQTNINLPHLLHGHLPGGLRVGGIHIVPCPFYDVYTCTLDSCLRKSRSLAILWVVFSLMVPPPAFWYSQNASRTALVSCNRSRFSWLKKKMMKKNTLLSIVTEI